MAGTIVIRKSNGSLEGYPPSTTAIESDGGVYLSYDFEPSKFDYEFLAGAEVVGSFDGDLDYVHDPADDESWLSELKEEWE